MRIDLISLNLKKYKFIYMCMNKLVAKILVLFDDTSILIKFKSLKNFKLFDVLRMIQHEYMSIQTD